MDIGALKSRDDDCTRIATVYRAANAWERLRGLLGRPPLGLGEGMLLAPCRSIHTCFMTYPLDIVYLDRHLVVIRMVPQLRPWRASMAVGAAMTLELAAGGAAAAGLATGMALSWQTRA